MDIGAYRQYLKELLKDALENSNGSSSQISEYLREKKISGILVRHRQEKERALADAKNAFDEHSYWPVDIIISHLGIDPEEIGYKINPGV